MDKCSNLLNKLFIWKEIKELNLFTLLILSKFISKLIGGSKIFNISGASLKIFLLFSFCSSSKLDIILFFNKSKVNSTFWKNRSFFFLYRSNKFVLSFNLISRIIFNVVISSLLISEYLKLFWDKKFLKDEFSLCSNI